jgi:hypothetical protein
MSFGLPTSPSPGQVATVGQTNWVYTATGWQRAAAVDRLKTVNGQSLAGSGNVTVSKADVGLGDAVVADPTTKALSSAAGSIPSLISDSVITASSMSTGTSANRLAPAFVRSIGASNAVAVAMEAFSQAMPKDARWNEPRVVEQGVIELGAIAYALDKTITINIANASASRVGLTIRGQGSESTKFVASSTSSAANFKGADNIWRMIQITSSVNSGNLDTIVLEKFGLFNYFTQNGDGVTRISDDVRVLDTNYINNSRYNNLSIYSRNLTALSRNQFNYYIRRNYYGAMFQCQSISFGHANAGIGLTGTAATRRCGVGYAFEENNAFQVHKIFTTGSDSAILLKYEDGFAAYGVDIEHSNKGFTLIDKCQNVRIYGVRDEMHMIQASGASAVEAPEEMYLARFSTSSENNRIEMAAGSSCPTIGQLAVVDQSSGRSNKVISNQGSYAITSTPLVTTAAVSGLTVATSTDVPYNSSAATSTEVAWPGAYNNNRSWTFAVDPEVGSITTRMWIKRVSGDGMMNARLETSDNIPVYYGYLGDVSRRFAASGLALTIDLQTTGHSYAAGSLTLLTKRAHLLQPGMRIQAATAIGTIASSTNLYVATTPTPQSLTVVVADPGTIGTTASLTVPSDMTDWLAQSPVTNWRELVSPIRIRNAVTAIALNGTNNPQLTFESPVSTLGMVTGSVIKLHGFKDSRLNIDYTPVAGDLSGNVLTLSTVTAAGLVVTAAGAGIDQDTSPRYGYGGVKNLRVVLRGLTTSGTACVWRCTDPVILRGHVPEFISA